jgi:hypothetical protein
VTHPLCKFFIKRKNLIHKKFFFGLLKKKMSVEGGTFESFVLLLSKLLEQLDVLDWDAKKSKTKLGKTFTVPYKTLLHEAGRADLAAKPEKNKVIQVLRRSKTQLEDKIARELQGDPFSLIPVLQFFGQFQKGTKRERPETTTSAVAVATPHSQTPSHVNKYALFSVPGAQKTIRMSMPLYGGLEMASWIYEYMMTSSQGRFLSDETVEVWLRQQQMANNVKVTPKLLRLQEAISCRKEGMLLILDLNAFTSKYLSDFGEIKDYAKLATVIALRWSDLKTRQPWIDLPSKQIVLADLVDPTLRFTTTEWDMMMNKVGGESYVIVTSEMISSMVSQTNPSMLAFAKKALGLRCKVPPFVANLQTVNDVAQFFGFGLAKRSEIVNDVANNADIYLDIVPSFDKRGVCLLLHSIGTHWSCLFSRKMVNQVSNMLKSDDLPSDIHASRVFAKTGRVPKGLQCDKEGISIVSHPNMKLYFAWYVQKNGLTDLDQLFQDAYQLLRDGPPKSMSADSAEFTFTDMVKSLGLLGALQKLTDTRQYPQNVFPVFDMRFISAASQSYAYEIHRLTGRFTNHITGYYNNVIGARVLLQDICQGKKIRDDVLQARPWITPIIRRHFSPIEICLLMVSVFGGGANANLGSHFDSIKIRLGKTDVQGLRVDAPHITLQQLHANAANKLVGLTQADIEQTTNYYLRMIMETEGPFLVYRQQQLDEKYSRAVLCEQHPISFQPGVSFLDLPLGIGNFTAWINQQSRHREHLMPNVPCEIRIRKTGETAMLVVFKYEKDRWHVWNGTSMAEYSRRDFDIIEQNRCLPAPVHILATNGAGIALKRSLAGTEDTYWVKQSSDSCEVKMTLGKHFTWSNDVYFNPKMLQHQVAASERAPELVDEVFDQDSAFVYQAADEMILPGKECNDWAMREFFSKKSHQSIWPFVRFFQMQITTEILYHAFFLDAETFQSEKSWAARSKLHVFKACDWFWQRIITSDINYDRMIWQTKLKGREASPDTFAYVMNLLYENVK